MQIMLIGAHPDAPMVLADLARGLHDLGHSIVLVVPCPGLISKAVVDDGIECYYINIRSSLVTNSFLKKRAIDLAAIRELRSLYANIAPDIISAHLLRGRVLGRLASWPNGPQIVSTVHGPDLENNWYLAMERSSNRIDAATIAISSDTKEYLASKGIPSQKTRVVHNGLDLCTVDKIPIQRGSVRRSLGIGGQEFVVGMVAYMYPYIKGHETFLRAAQRVLRENTSVKFVLVGGPLYDGDGWYETQLHQLAAELGVQEDVLFVGRQDNPFPMFDAMDVLVLPSNVREGFGMVLVEAMARRKPVVGSRIGGIPEVVQEGVTGFLVPPGNDVVLADTILRLADDSELAYRMGLAGRQRVEQFFQRDVMAKGYERVFVDVLQEGV